MTSSSDLSNNVTRTALDALHAKASAILNAGYRPVLGPGVVVQQQGAVEEDVIPVVPQRQGAVDEYMDLIRRAVAIGISDDAGVTTVKRQTPLVHAGYALRIQAILSTIGNFASIVIGSRGGDEKNKSNDKNDMPAATIILLGSGMDVTGLWAARTFPNVFGHVIEIDLPTVCASKREMLQHQSLVDFEINEMTTTTDTASTTRQDVVIHHGILARQHSPSTQRTTFSLVEADLRDQHDWKCVLEGLWNPQAPTLVISEVVLAYLANEDDAVNTVLSAWAAALQHPESCLVLLEPLGPVLLSDYSDANTARTATTDRKHGVLHSYQLAYTQLFQSKLERGIVSSKDINRHSAFAPIGSSPSNVARRLLHTGWGSAVAVSLAQATSNTSLQQANEPFDEHAALLLYAQSYVVAGAFPAACCCSSTLSSSSAALFRRVMAPGKAAIPPFQPTKEMWIATIDRTEEVTVKSLFVDGYADLCKMSKSVRRLVKGAFKKAFILTPEKVDDNDFTSNFAKYYQNRGGCFLVAIDAATRQIAGFIALCKVSPPPPSPNAKNSILLQYHDSFFEVQRLFVVAEYRCRGVAGHLMDAVQRFGLAQSKSPTTGAIVTFLAATLNVLHDANRFYSRRGFTIQDEVPLQDNITIYTYMLEVQKPPRE